MLLTCIVAAARIMDIPLETLADRITHQRDDMGFQQEGDNPQPQHEPEVAQRMKH